MELKTNKVHGILHPSKCFRIVMTVVLILLMIPIFLQYISTNLDNSWAYFLNWVPYTDFKFGKDIVFTYGPLGFLLFTQNVGNNVIISSIFWSLIVFFDAFILISILFFEKKTKIPNFNLLVSLLLYFFSLNFQSYIRVEYYLLGTVFLALSAAWFCEKKSIYFLISVLITSITIFIKITNTIFALSAIIVLLVLIFFKNRALAYKFLAMALIIPAVFIIGYLIYNPSLPDMLTYLISSLDFSSGYSSAMSLSSVGTEVAVALVSLLFAILFLLRTQPDKKFLLYSLISAGPLYLLFKHAFVRADIHICIFFEGFLLILSVMFLFFDFSTMMDNSKHRKPELVSLLLLLCILLPSLTYSYLCHESLADVPTTVINELTFRTADKIKEPLDTTDQSDILSTEMMDIIGSETVTAFPWECSYAAYNKITFVPMTVLQNYAAYTPRLDEMNATFFSAATSPEYIIFSMHSIDGRFALLESPLTWNSIYLNYSVILVNSDCVLLKKEKRDILQKTICLSTAEYDKNAVITIPQSDKLVTLKADMHLSLWGRLVCLFYKIPEVTMTISLDDKPCFIGRILPENLESGVLINHIPVDTGTFADIMENSSRSPKVTHILFGGAGLKYYENNISCEFQTTE